MTDFRRLRRAWRLLAVFCALLVGHVIVYMQMPDRGQSGAFRALALAAVTGCVLVIAVALMLRPAHPDRLRRLARRGHRLYILAALSVIFGFGLFMRPEWVYVHMALALIALAALIEHTLYGDEPAVRLPRWVLPVGIAVVGAVIGVRVLGLSHYPGVHIVDEPWTLGWAVSYARVGYPLDWIMLNVDRGAAFYLPRFYQPMGWWLSLVGVGFWEARLFNLLLALAAIPFAAGAAARLYGRPTGLLVAVLLFASPLWMAAARIRHDVGLALAMVISLWIYTEAIHRKRPLLHLLAGLAMGWGMFAHYHAPFLGAAMLAGLYLPDYVRGLRAGRVWPPMDLVWYAMGGGLGGFSVALVQILPDVAVFTGRIPARAPQDIGQLFGTFTAHIGNFVTYSPLEAVVAGMGLAAAIWRRDWLPAAVVLLSLMALAVAAAVTADYHHVPLAPFYALLTARLLLSGWQRRSTVVAQGVRVGGAGVAVVLLGVSLSAPVSYVRSGSPLRPAAPPAAAWVREHVPPETTILADNLYFLWLHDYRYASILTPTYLLYPEDRARYAADPFAFWDELQVQVIIRDPALSSHDQIERLLDAGYLVQGGFTAAAQFDDVTIYRR